MLPKEIFLSEYYEKRPCLMRQGAIKTKMDWADVDDALYIGEQGNNGILLHRGGSFVDEREYSELCVDIERRRRAIKKEKFREIVGEGASIIFNRMESVSAPVRAICQQLARYVEADTAANGYISFGGEQAFGNHWDTHDVFAVQLLGRKKWTMFEPTFTLPLKDQRSGQFKDECPKTPVMEVTLEQGDVLYVPRGWWHNACALESEPTFHIAVGVHPTIVFDYVKWLCSEELVNHEVFRKSLVNPLKHEVDLRALGDKVASLFSSREALDRFLSIKADSARWFSQYNMEFDFVDKSEFISNEIKLTVNWVDISGKIRSRVRAIALDNEEYALSLLDKISHRPEGITFDELIPSESSFPHSVSKKLVRDLIKEDLISIVTI